MLFRSPSSGVAPSPDAKCLRTSSSSARCKNGERLRKTLTGGLTRASLKSSAQTEPLLFSDGTKQDQGFLAAYSGVFSKKSRMEGPKRKTFILACRSKNSLSAF